MVRRTLTLQDYKDNFIYDPDKGSSTTSMTGIGKLKLGRLQEEVMLMVTKYLNSKMS